MDSNECGDNEERKEKKLAKQGKEKDMALRRGAGRLRKGKLKRRIRREGLKRGE